MTLALLAIAGCELSKYPIDDPAVVKIDTRLLGKWKVDNEQDKHDLYTLTRKDDFHYHVTVANALDKKVHKATAYLSNVGSLPFLNVYFKDDTASGYLFIKILNVNATGDKIITATVSDTTMKYLKSPAQVRARIQQRLNYPSFYSDTTHLHKVKQR